MRENYKRENYEEEGYERNYERENYEGENYKRESLVEVKGEEVIPGKEVERRPLIWFEP